MISIAIVEDNTQFRDGLAFLINTSKKYRVDGIYGTAEEALENIGAVRPGIVLMDIDLPGIDGINCTKEIKKKLPETEIVMITALENSERVFDALCAGATGYVTKNSDITEIIGALDEVLKGGAPMSASIARLVVNKFKKNIENTPLNDIETIVLNFLSEGKSYKTVSSLLDTGIDNVKYYIKNIYFKLQVNNKEDAIEKAKSNNWI
jgi:DNA-binding NarL/FixJ family response regulator